MNNILEFDHMHVDLPIIAAGIVIGEFNLKTKKINTEGSTPIKFKCSSTADCCSILKIPITDFDIKRIEDQGYEIDQIVESLSPQLRLPRTEFGNIEKNYWMKSNPFTGECTFLEDGLCKIHEFKPLGCLVFPFSIKYIDSDRVTIKIHPSNTCRTVSVCKSEEADNEKLLIDLLTIVLEEESFKIQYFAKYGCEL